MFLKTSRKLGRRFLSSPTYVYDHHFSPKYCNFLKKALPPKLTISNSIFHVTGRVNFLIYQSELYSSPAYKRIKTAQFNNAVQDHWRSGPCFFLYPHHQPHSHIRSFLLLYPNSKSGKAFRDQFSTLGPSFYRKKTEAQRMTCPWSHKIFKTFIITLPSY